MSTATEASEQANRSGLDPKRLVVIFYLITGVILALFLGRILGLLWAQFGWRDPEVVEGMDWTVTGLIGIALALAVAVGAWTNARTRTLSMETASELMKVTWPTWAETRVATAAVVIASMVAAVILFGIDTIAYKVMVEWLPSVWGKL